MLSITGFLTIAGMGSLLILLLSLVLKSNFVLTRVGVGILIFASFVIMARLFIPVELGFEKSFYFTSVLPQFCDFLTLPFATIGGRSVNLLGLCLFVWAAGFFVYSGWALFIYKRFLHTLLGSETACDPVATGALLALYKQRKSRARFRLLQTPLVDTPMLVGLVRPRIVLPKIQLSGEEWACVLLHEMAHRDCRDLWTKLFCEFLCALYWWNPAVHILRARLVRALEIRGDATATHSMGHSEKTKYLECLLKLAKLRAPCQKYAPALTFAPLGKSALEQRSVLLCAGKKRAGARVCSTLLALVVSFAAIALSFSFVLEPEYVPEDCISITPENAYLVAAHNGGYFIYIDGVYTGTASEKMEVPEGVPVYTQNKSEEDV